MIANLMVFYKGALSYHDLQEMPYPEVFKLNKLAAQINEETQRAMKG